MERRLTFDKSHEYIGTNNYSRRAVFYEHHYWIIIRLLPQQVPRRVKTSVVYFYFWSVLYGTRAAIMIPFVNLNEDEKGNLSIVYKAA